MVLEVRISGYNGHSDIGLNLLQKNKTKRNQNVRLTVINFSTYSMKNNFNG